MDDEDGVVNSPPNKRRVQSPVCSPSPLKKTLWKVNSRLQNQCGCLVLQKSSMEFKMTFCTPQRMEGEYRNVSNLL